MRIYPYDNHKRQGDKSLKTKRDININIVLIIILSVMFILFLSGIIILVNAKQKTKSHKIMQLTTPMQTDNIPIKHTTTLETQDDILVVMKTKERPHESKNDISIDNIDISEPAYTNEYNLADKKYQSDTLWVTSNNYKTKDQYILTHIVCADTNIPKVSMGQTKTKLLENIQESHNRLKWSLGISASSYNTKRSTIDDGVYINDGECIYGDKTIGTEMCITSDGTLYSPDTNVSADQLIQDDVMYTIVSIYPTLIIDGTKQPIQKDNELAKIIIGMVRPKEYYIIATNNGTYIDKNTYADYQDILLEKGCVYAKALNVEADTNVMLNGKTLNNSPAKHKQALDFLTFN